MLPKPGWSQKEKDFAAATAAFADTCVRERRPYLGAAIGAQEFVIRAMPSNRASERWDELQSYY